MNFKALCLTFSALLAVGGIWGHIVGADTFLNLWLPIVLGVFLAIIKTHQIRARTGRGFIKGYPDE